MPRPRNADKIEYHTRRAQQEQEDIDYMLKNRANFSLSDKYDLRAARKRKNYHESIVRNEIAYRKKFSVED